MNHTTYSKAKISYIHFENFKSFQNATIDFHATKNSVKNIAVIFGENGSGKSSIIESIRFLYESIQTRCTSQNFERFIELRNAEDLSKYDPTVFENLLSTIQGNYSSLANLVMEVKSINSNGPLSLTYGFQLDGFDGEYTLSFSNESMIYEKMVYVIDERKTTLWEFSHESLRISGKLFRSNKYCSDITEQYTRYWGKHSFLAILNFEKEDKTFSFIDNNFSVELKKLLDFFNSFSYCINYWNSNISQFNSNDEILEHLDEGTIPSTEKATLLRTEAALAAFFRSIFTNIENVFYKQKLSNSEITYELMLRKKVNGKIMDISIQQESSGTQELIYFLPYLISAMNGHIVFIDEFGSSLHEQLVPALIQAVNENISGQLIVTSHRLSILDKAGLSGESFYYITAGKKCEKQILCTTDIETRLHTSYNYRNRYLTKNEYHMQPIHGNDETYINFDYFLINK